MRRGSERPGMGIACRSCWVRPVRLVVPTERSAHLSHRQPDTNVSECWCRRHAQAHRIGLGEFPHDAIERIPASLREGVDDYRRPVQSEPERARLLSLALLVTRACR